jgi:hypothetical protein
MTTLTKFADNMRGINSKLAAIKATTSELSLAEKRQLLDVLASDIQAATAAVDAPKRRLASVQAASTATDQRTKEAFKFAVSGLQKLGYAIDHVCASGNVAELDAKMKEFKWAPERRTRLKLCLGIIGAIA